MCYMANRRRVGVRELRQNLSVHLRRVKKGEALEVTERGQPVAILAPLPEAMGPIARLRLEGRIARTATGRLEDVRPVRGPGLGEALRRALEEQRADRIS
jgi:prevent-host-death family protein